MVVLLAAATAFVLILSVIWHRHSRCKDLIEAESRRYHFTEIRASIVWGSLDLHAYTYNVRYMDTRGRRHRNRAKVQVRTENADTVHWRHRIERPSSQRKALRDDVDRDAGVTLEGRLPLITDVGGRHVTK